jgi:hypothetical protein
MCLREFNPAKMPGKISGIFYMYESKSSPRRLPLITCSFRFHISAIFVFYSPPAGGRKSFTVARYGSIFTLRRLADDKIKSYKNLKPNHIKLLAEGA